MTSGVATGFEAYRKEEIEIVDVDILMFFRQELELYLLHEKSIIHSRKAQMNFILRSTVSPATSRVRPPLPTLPPKPGHSIATTCGLYNPYQETLPSLNVILKYRTRDLIGCTASPAPSKLLSFGCSEALTEIDGPNERRSVASMEPC